MSKFKCNINYKNNLDKEIITKLELDGFVQIINAISKKDLIYLKNKVKTLTHEMGERYFTIINPHKKEFLKISDDSDLFSLARKIAEKKLKRQIEKNDFLSVLRVITGEKVNQQSYKFHFDAYILTILVPINIPNTGKNDGHLILFPNFRKTIRFTLINFIEKTLYQNYLSRKLIRFISKKNLEKFVFKLKPGNIYFFWGYQSLHANLPINKHLLRSSLLLHFGTVHNKSLLDKIIKKTRHWIETKNAKNF